MKEEKLWQLISSKLSGEATLHELEELNYYITNHPELSLKVAMLEDFWKSKQSPSAIEIDRSFDKHLQRLSNHLSSPALQYEESKNVEDEIVPLQTISTKRRTLWIAGIAISLLVVVAAYFLLYNSNTSSKLSENVVATKSGSKSKVTLPDGTQVWLNSESKLTYNDKFATTLREVELTGEAFFDVVKDNTRPFIIHTQTIDVKVLGTAFNVRSYPNEKTVETSLIRGVVEVTVKRSPDKKIILKPNEKLVVQNQLSEKEGKESLVASSDKQPLMVLTNLHFFKGDSSAIETSWVKNKLAFDGETLAQVANKIERWYGVEIMIKDDKLKEGEYTGVFEDESLAEVMEALKLTGNFSYEINKKQVLIKP